MSQFTDALGRKWSIEITVLSVKQLRQELGVDLLSLADKPAPGQVGLLQRLASDPVLLVDVISVLLSTEIRNRSLNELEFARGLVGTGILAACDALIEAIVNFTPPQQGQLIKTMHEKVKLIESAGYSKVSTMLESRELSQKLDNLLEQEFQKAITSIQTSTQPS
jgi:hypothetical protein